MMMKKVREQSKTTRQELVHGLKATETSVIKKTFGNTLCRNGLKSWSAHKVFLLRKARAHLKFASEYLNDSDEAWEKVLWSYETNIELFGTNSTRCAQRMNKSCYDPKNTFPQ